MLKSTFLILLALLLCISFHDVHSQTDSVDTTDSGEGTDTDTDTAASDDTGDDDGDDDDDDDDDDSFDNTSDSDDDDDDDDDDDSDDDGSDDDDSDDDDSDSMDVTGDSDDSDDDDSDDDDSGSTDSDDDDSDDDDSDDDDSDDSDDDSDDDSSEGGSGSGGSTATTASGVNEFVDPCVGLTVSQCNQMYDSSGNAICAQNVVTDNCYSVVASKGIYGSGNYDDGYTAAQQSTAEESQKLNTIVGVLAGIITILALALIGGGYYLHTKSKRMDAMKHENIAMETVQSQTHEEQDSMLEA